MGVERGGPHGGAAGGGAAGSGAGWSDGGEQRLDPGERVFHLARRDDWLAAQEAGDYRVSTVGRTLAEEGFIHASRRGQVRGVYDAFYADVEDPLVLLEIDPALLTCPVILEVPPGAHEAFPHLYGPLELAAVVAVTPYFS